MTKREKRKRRLYAHERRALERAKRERGVMTLGEPQTLRGAALTEREAQLHAEMMRWFHEYEAQKQRASIAVGNAWTTCALMAMLALCFVMFS